MAITKKEKKLKAIRNRVWYKEWSEMIELSDTSDITSLLMKVFKVLDSKKVFMYHRSMLWSLESLHQALKDHGKDNEVEDISKTIKRCGYEYSKEIKKLRKKKQALAVSERRLNYGNDIPF